MGNLGPETEIGGYFGLELARAHGAIPPPHDTAIALNSARNGFLYVLDAERPNKVYLPCFICNSMVETLEWAGISYEFYSVNEQLESDGKFDIRDGERLVVVDYFGINSAYCGRAWQEYGQALFVDSTQAFFSAPIEGCDTIYSPRKFFGVSDGGYLYTDRPLPQPAEEDTSYEAARHLVGRIDRTAAEFYTDYRKAEERLAGKPVKTMSRLTRAILASVDYELVRKTRERNFLYLHSALASVNKMSITLENLCGPMVYPLWTDDVELRERLQRARIYVATYWPGVSRRACSSKLERDFVDNLLPLPIDQRYGLNEMQKIIDVVRS